MQSSSQSLLCLLNCCRLLCMDEWFYCLVDTPMSFLVNHSPIISDQRANYISSPNKPGPGRGGGGVRTWHLAKKHWSHKCHINDLPDVVKSQVRLFADDCVLYRPVKSQCDHIKLQDDLSRLHEWACTWGMRFNTSKCQVMSICPKSSHFYNINGHILKHTPQEKYLGIILSDDLKWTPHINSTTKKANAVLGLLRRNLQFCPEQCKRTAYIALTRSILEYGAGVWDPYLQKDIVNLERVQRRALRFITGDYSSRDPGSITNMRQRLNQPP